MAQAKARQSMARSRGTAAKLRKPVLRVSECDAIDTCDISCQKGLAPRSSSHSAELPPRHTVHAARLNRWYEYHNPGDMVNDDQLRNGIGRVAVDLLVRGVPVASGPCQDPYQGPSQVAVSRGISP